MGMCSRVVYLDLEEDQFLTFGGTAILIWIVAVLVYTSTSNEEHSPCSTPYKHELSHVILTGVRWNLRDVLFCISLMAKDFFKCFLVI